jgi:hypothetical protein
VIAGFGRSFPPDTTMSGAGGGRPQAAQQIVQSVQRHVPRKPGRPPFAVPGDYHRFPLTLSPADAAAAAASPGSVGGDIQEEIVTRTPVSCPLSALPGSFLLEYYRFACVLGFFVRIGV